MARQLFLHSWGRVTPKDIEGNTYDQLIIMWSDAVGGGVTSMSYSEAAKAGYVPPHGKTGVQMAKDKAAAMREADRAQKRRRRRGNG